MVVLTKDYGGMNINKEYNMAQPKRPITNRELRDQQNILGKVNEQTTQMYKDIYGYENPTIEEEIKAERDRLLAASDWILASDSQASDECIAAYIVYRQALRDLPSQEYYPETIEWPEKPAYEKEEVQ